MRTALVLVGVVLLLAAGALALFLTAGTAERGADPVAAPAAVPANAPEETARERSIGEILARLDALSRAVDELNGQVAELRAGAAREPVAAPADVEPVDEASSVFAATHRQAILQVIEDDRRSQQAKRDEEQRARDLQSALARAERTAQRFGLAADQQKAVADVYLLERQKMEEMRSQMRDPSLIGDPEGLRESFRTLRDWRVNELTTRLGADLAQKISDSDLERIRGGMRRQDRAQDPAAGGPGNQGGGSPPGDGQR